MSTELAREIIAQSRPRDQHSRLSITLMSRNFPDENRSRTILKIFAPVVNGEQVIGIVVPDKNELRQRPLHYNANSNLEGAARLVDWATSNHDVCHVLMHPLNENGVETGGPFPQLILRRSDSADRFIEDIRWMIKVLLAA